MPSLYTTDKNLKFMTPVYSSSGQWAHGIEKLGPTEYYAERRNRKKYGRQAFGQSFPDQASALAWCQQDWDQVLYPNVAPTTLAGSFVQPAIGATVAATVASATGIRAPQTVTVAGAGSGGTVGTYYVQGVAGAVLTLYNPGGNNGTPGTTVPTGGAVTVVPK
jgi:hypothetical protein